MKMLHSDYAEILLERQLAATDWIIEAPPVGCDLTEVTEYRRKLVDIKTRQSWGELWSVVTPRFRKPDETVRTV